MDKDVPITISCAELERLISESIKTVMIGAIDIFQKELGVGDLRQVKNFSPAQTAFSKAREKTLDLGNFKLKKIINKLRWYSGQRYTFHIRERD